MSINHQNLSSPTWNRRDWLAVVGAKDGTYRTRTLKRELPWSERDGIDLNLGHKRYSRLHALAWRAAEALSLSPRIAAAVLRVELPNIRRMENALYLGDNRENVNLAYMELGFIDNDDVHPSIESFVGKFSDIDEWRLRTVNQRASFEANAQDTRQAVYAKRIVIVDLTSLLRVIESNAKNLVAQSTNE